MTFYVFSIYHRRRHHIVGVSDVAGSSLVSRIAI